ncbi:septal ring lytic transglycosylase RlpA family protein [Helicobacter zhangjianzhongii]|uniref:septal ring lytic transglycosylase RlpA family protein n=1 Tax=Helicobacter zhangjianzhongii TaxID=2974574 RepID=UPI003D9C6AEB
MTAQARPILLLQAFSAMILGLLAMLGILGCANESVYRGGIGAFSDYDSLQSYRSTSSPTANYINQAFGGDVFTLGKNGSNFSASNAPSDSFSGSNASLLRGMRESEAIQRATMRPYQIAGKWYYPTQVKVGKTFDGIASWYGPNFHAKATSNGETYNMHAHTAASKTLPMNTIVKVFNKDNGKTTIVRINDRGPFVDGRIIDLSNAAAKDIDMVQKGTAKVRIEVIGFGGKVDKHYQNTLNVSNEAIQDEFEVGSDESQAVSGGSFSLQLGVFKQKGGAESTKQKYSDTNYNAIIKEQDGLYRVFLQGFQSEEEAQDFAKSHSLSPVIVRD